MANFCPVGSKLLPHWKRRKVSFDKTLILIMVFNLLIIGQRIFFLVQEMAAVFLEKFVLVMNKIFTG